MIDSIADAIVIVAIVIAIAWLAVSNSNRETDMVKAGMCKTWDSAGSAYVYRPCPPKP